MSFGSKINFSSFLYLPAQSHSYIAAFRVETLSMGSELTAQNFIFHFLLPGFEGFHVSVILQNVHNAVISSNVSTISMNLANHGLKYKTASIRDYL